MRGQSTQFDVVSEAMLQDLKRFVCAEAVEA